jgi:hypothetical protein
MVHVRWTHELRDLVHSMRCANDVYCSNLQTIHIKHSIYCVYRTFIYKILTTDHIIYRNIVIEDLTWVFAVEVGCRWEPGCQWFTSY